MLIIRILLMLWLMPIHAQDDILIQQQWQHRFLIGVQNDKQAWLNLMSVVKTAEAQQELKERKLVLLVVVDEQLHQYGDVSIPQDTAQVIHSIRERLTAYKLPGYALMGLDGGIKAYYPGNRFNLEAMFMSIDRMPMRQAELNSRQD
ncbi:DUF4174 domain-containing protein [Marinicella sp. W31]|uniref:DUF4174 domain-containing protein n=1 Tax=Marinicella sp. W31 TaxID=3023713 RepID=UPI00375683AC